ncbi:hypothetical protein BST36_29830 [Mycolicibacterium moriokaense]|uniref:Uncharacterized protein n=1 Tax=Mycolicibacterium moriokaense TaxID=39691 RepID=A0AAD1M870_9MYCO|nr:hypothetical protein [Mycolicibacterium moriokaense]MCV7043058.1 hypothetical protein [Mycolicibacterium moriokaense]ORB12840.1 hypothetical protein BST36_29830 [Mycolicibacterium moriokaense]BBX04637.1 hypothetical protein MMOR_55730 [Mycolicibacterium moriokaense]
MVDQGLFGLTCGCDLSAAVLGHLAQVLDEGTDPAFKVSHRLTALVGSREREVQAGNTLGG